MIDKATGAVSFKVPELFEGNLPLALSWITPRGDDSLRLRTLTRVSSCRAVLNCWRNTALELIMDVTTQKFTSGRSDAIQASVADSLFVTMITTAASMLLSSITAVQQLCCAMSHASVVIGFKFG